MGRSTKTLPQHLKTHKRDDLREFSGIGITALLVEGIVLDEVDVDEVGEGGGHVFGGVKGCDELVAEERMG